MHSPGPITLLHLKRRMHFMRALVFAVVATIASLDSAAVTLRVFGGGPSQRPDLLRQLLDDYERLHPDTHVEIATGGATSEVQRKYLTTLLNAGDSTFDAILIDIVTPAQFASAGWIEPLDTYFGPQAAAFFSQFLPVYREVDRYDGRWVAAPFDTGALFLFYRSDLLEKYGRPVPRSWNELADTADFIVSQEKRRGLIGLSFQGAPIEGTVASFLVPYWSAGGEFLDAQGKLTLNRNKALGSFRLWLGLIIRGTAPHNSAEVKTGDTINEFAAGQAVFAVNWGFAWDIFARADPTAGNHRFGVAQIPAVDGGQALTTIGGYQWALSTFSHHKKETAELIRYLTSEDSGRWLTIQGYSLPSRAAAYTDPAILAARPWVALAGPIVQEGRPRPVTPSYAEVSEILRRTTSAVLGGSISPEEGFNEMERRLRRVLR